MDQPHVAQTRQDAPTRKELAEVQYEEQGELVSRDDEASDTHSEQSQNSVEEEQPAEDQELPEEEVQELSEEREGSWRVLKRRHLE